MTGWFIAQVRGADIGSERLHPNTGTIERVLRARSDLTNDRSRFARARRVVSRLGEEFQVPVVEIAAAAISGFGRAGIREHEVTGQ